MKTTQIVVSLCCSIALCCAPYSKADNWPQWRGPHGNGVAPAGDYPTSFSASKSVLWKVELPGRGSSTPAVWEEKIFVTSPIDFEDGVLCYDFDGKEKWRQTFGKERAGKHKKAGSGSNPSPTTDGERVYVYFKSGRLAAIDFSGKTVWQHNLQEKFGEDTLWWDLGTSPVIAAGKIVVAVMQEGESFLVAFDAKTGAQAWKQDRKFDCAEESDQSYTTPQVIKEGDKELLVTWGADHLTAHDASDGKLIWTCGGFNPDNKVYWRVIASPAITDGIALVPYARGKMIAAIKLQGSGDITGSARLWDKSGWGSDVPTPIAHDGKFLLLTDRCQLAYFDAQTGKELWSDRIKGGNKVYSSPVLAGDKLYFAAETGVVYSGRVTDDGYKLLAKCEMEERIIATPVAVNDKLLIRGQKHLFCVGKETEVRKAQAVR